MVLLRRAEQPRRKKQSNQRGGKQPRYQEGRTAEPNGGQAVVIWKHSSSRYQYENNWDDYSKRQVIDLAFFCEMQQ